MVVAALADLTGSGDALHPLADAIGGLEYCHRVSFEIRESETCGIRAKQLAIEIREEFPESRDAFLADAGEIARGIGLSENARNRALGILGELVSTGERIHAASTGISRVASIDTLFDIMGSVLLLDRHGYLEGEIYGTPPALGDGMVRIGGAVMAGPAPATLEILRAHSVPWSVYPAGRELTTPTGAALLANLASRIMDTYPALTPVKTGYGTGCRDLPQRPDLLRLVAGKNFHAVSDRITMLETNLDDVSGETIGYTIERLREAGAVDVYLTTASGKKNRPVQILHVITSPESYTDLLSILMEETGTLGVRVMDIPRLVADRSRHMVSVEISGKTFEISVKISAVDGTIIGKKPEYEDVKRIARTVEMPIRYVAEELQRQIAQMSF